MTQKGITISVIFGLIFIFSIQATNAAEEISNLDLQNGFNNIQQPFSDFFESASKINISGERSSTQSTFPVADQFNQSWESTNQWLKEKTGLDLLGILKVIGNVLIFVMNLAITAMNALIKVIQWLLSLIPGAS